MFLISRKTRTAPCREERSDPKVFLRSHTAPLHRSSSRSASPRRSSCALSRRAKSAFPLRCADPPPRSARTSSWLEERPAVSLVDLNARIVRESDQEGRVRRFCDSLREHQTALGFDYYSRRAEEASRRSRGEEEGEEGERKRETGDMHLRNLTFRSLQQPLFIYTHGVGRAKPNTRTLSAR